MLAGYHFNRMILAQKTTKLFMSRKVVLVNEKDQELGTADIYVAHQNGGLKHRALSVILYRHLNGKLELLHQKRASAKPVFKDLWSNTCCTNMRPGDTYLPRAVSRLDEEMGIKVTEEHLRILYSFSYEAEDTTQPGWGENELDTVIAGEWDGEVHANPDEASAYKWIEWENLKQDIKKYPSTYSPWHKMIVRDQRFVEAIYES